MGFGRQELAEMVLHQSRGQCIAVVVGHDENVRLAARCAGLEPHRQADDGNLVNQRLRIFRRQVVDAHADGAVPAREIHAFRRRTDFGHEIADCVFDAPALDDDLVIRPTCWARAGDVAAAASTAAARAM